MPGEAFITSDPSGPVDPPQHLVDEYKRLKQELEGLLAEEHVITHYDSENAADTVELAEDILALHAGLDLNTPHGKDTPTRFVNMLDELTKCKNCDGSCIKWKTFEENVDQMIVVNRIPFSSVCNHHVVPFVGFAWIGYVPNGMLAGLSKFARATHHFARRLQVQEKLTDDIANFIETELSPKGVIVVMEAEHLCMTIRGTQTPGTTTRTVVTTGVFADHGRTAKAEFLGGIK